ncbi:BCCT family transporter, partial [Larsenimonas salina]|uniref:BCCT family transporter n=1 Tax=Larsenimonas salina TaxID=1295565 RepID=UPI002072C9CF
TYFITSADSGTLVLCILDSGGHQEPPQVIRVLWGVIIACIASALLYAGGLETIQTASIIAGFPIAIFILVITISLYRSLRREPMAAAMLPPQARPADETLDHHSGTSDVRPAAAPAADTTFEASVRA